MPCEEKQRTVERPLGIHPNIKATAIATKHFHDGSQLGTVDRLGGAGKWKAEVQVVARAPISTQAGAAETGIGSPVSERAIGIHHNPIVQD